MIPYNDLLRALSDWRARQGLPPLHGLDYLGALKQPRIDTSRAIAAITGSMELLDLETAGADYDYDEPLAPPPMDQPVSAGWSDYDSDATRAASDDVSGAGYEYEQPQPAYAAPSEYDEQSGYDQQLGYDEQPGYDQQPLSDYGQQAQSGYDYEQAQPGFDVHSVGDSTAIYQDLSPSQGAPGYAPVPTDPSVSAMPSYGFDDEPNDESTMIGAMPVPSGAAAPPVAAPPPSSDATAIFDTSLATNAAARVEAEYRQPGGGVPSEPVYDSMAAAAEYQAERVAEENAGYADDLDEHTYVPTEFQGAPEEPMPPSYPPAQSEFAPADEPPPLEPPPGLPGDAGFEIHFDDD